MYADRAPHVRELFGNLPHARKSVQPRADADQDPYSGVPRARHHRVELWREFWKVEMAMRVDEHQSAPARRDVAAIARAALNTVWRGSRYSAEERRKLASSLPRHSIHRSRFACPARARMRPANVCTRKAPNVSSPSLMRAILSPSDRIAAMSAAGALSTSRSASRARATPSPSASRSAMPIEPPESRAKDARSPASLSGSSRA